MILAIFAVVLNVVAYFYAVSAQSGLFELYMQSRCGQDRNTRASTTEKLEDYCRELLVEADQAPSTRSEAIDYFLTVFQANLFHSIAIFIIVFAVAYFLIENKIDNTLKKKED